MLVAQCGEGGFDGLLSGESGKEKTSVRTGFANMPLACWI